MKGCNKLTSQGKLCERCQRLLLDGFARDSRPRPRAGRPNKTASKTKETQWNIKCNKYNPWLRHRIIITKFYLSQRQKGSQYRFSNQSKVMVGIDDPLSRIVRARIPLQIALFPRLVTTKCARCNQVMYPHTNTILFI